MRRVLRLPHFLCIIRKKCLQDCIKLRSSLNLPGPSFRCFYVLGPIHQVVNFQDLIKNLLRKWLPRLQGGHTIQ